MVGTAIITGLVVTSVNIELAEFPMQEMADMLLPSASAAALTGILCYLVKVRKWNMYQLVGITLAAGIILKSAGILL